MKNKMKGGNMVKTSDKVLLSVLAVVFLGMAGAFITAVNSGNHVSQAVLTGEASYVLEDEADEGTEPADVPITGNALERASAVALAYIGEGKVTDTEVGDEEGYYEIEITLNSGTEIDVHLDENFNVLGYESDGKFDKD